MKKSATKYDELLNFLKSSISEISLDKTAKIVAAYIYGQNASRIIDGLDLVSDEIDLLIVTNSELKPGVSPIPKKNGLIFENFCFGDRKLRPIFNGVVPSNFDSKSELLIDIIGDGTININKKDSASIIASKKPKLLIFGEESYKHLSYEILANNQKVEIIETMTKYLNREFIPRKDFFAQRIIAKNVIFISSLLYETTIKLNDKSEIVNQLISKLKQDSTLANQLTYFYNIYQSNSLSDWENLKVRFNEFNNEILKIVAHG